MLTRDDILAILDKKGIEYREFFHSAVYTIEEAEHLSIPGFDILRVPKNLFLRDDKKRSYYLVSIEETKRADLKALRTLLSSRPLSFASEDDLVYILSLKKGEVTPFGLLNDKEHKAVFILDSYFEGGIIGIHPNDNTATVFLKTADLISILSGIGTEIRIISI